MDSTKVNKSTLAANVRACTLNIFYTVIVIGFLIFYKAYTSHCTWYCIILVFIISEVLKQDLRNYTKWHIRKPTVLLVMVTAIYYTISVLYGAPILSEFDETLQFALLMSTFTVLYALINIGYKATASLLMQLTNFNYTECANWTTLCSIQCTIFGSWSGAVAIPLDWNRDWQKWSIPCKFGVLGGFVIGQMMIIILLLYFSKKVRRCRV